MLEFPHGYFEDEVRDGFYVSSVMKKCWAAQLEVLSDIDKVCKRYDIKWFADCGTLLGAVRHGGFVPWDDDLDICMFRDDYHRFLSVASRELTNIWPGYKILNYHDGEYWEPISRIVNANDVEFSNARLDKFHGYPLAAGIDIFPLDFICPDEEEEEARKQLFKTIFDLADSGFSEHIDKSMLEELAQMVGRKYDDNKSAKLQLYEWSEIVSSLYRREEAEEVCLMTFWYRNNDHKYPIKLFDKTVQIPFENIMINAPAGYDQVLKIEYGDYMKIVRTGGIHEYPHYEEQVNMTNEWLGDASPFKRSITNNTPINRIRKSEEKEIVNTVKATAINTVNILFEAHDEIRKMLTKEDLYEAVNLLAQCQDTAIQIGTFIENKQGEGIITVTHLEKYCEQVYQLSEKIALFGEDISTLKDGIDNDVKDNLFSEDVDILNKQLNVIMNSINIDIVDMKEVVFLPIKPECWYIMDKMWKELNDDPTIRTLVMPIPYYEKTACGDLVYQCYNVTDYPDYLNLTDYRYYDFEKKHPDKIIIQYPFDNDNFVTTIDPKFYSVNLKQFTNELVYVPYFQTEEIGPGEERAYKVMSEYVITPAVVYSDRILLQSEDIKELYVKKLTEFFGEETKDIWESRIDGSYSHLYEKDVDITKDMIKMPDEWRKKIFKTDGTAKKVIIYRTSVSGLFEHRIKMIEKMKSVFETFKDKNGDVVVVWYPDSLIGSTIPTTDPELFEKYSKLVKEYITDGFGIYDDSGDVERVVMLADAYYGDTDKLVQVFRNRRIPVMIQNVEV